MIAAILLAGASRTGSAQNTSSPQRLQNHVPQLVSSHEATYVGALSIDRRMQLGIILPLRNQEVLQQLLTRIYDPASPDYHKFLSVEEFTAQFGPTEVDYEEVVQFAVANGLTVAALPANRLVITVDGTVAQVEHAFNVQLGEYLHPTEERTFYSPDQEPSVPVRAKIAYIDGLNSLYLPHAMSTIPFTSQPMVAVNGSGPSGSYLGSDMRAAYYGGNGLAGINQRVALVEFGGYLKTDVDLNFSGAGQTYGVPLNNILVGSATNAVYRQDGEQVLDIVQAIGMAPSLASVDVYIGDPTTAASAALVLNQIASDNTAKQIGCSWGWIPGSIPSQEAILAEMAAQGQTFFAASGDDGAFQYSISPYFYPGESQFATAVGGTHLATAAAGGAWSSEVAWNSSGHGSGGGISPDNIPIPSWQTGLVNSSNGGSSTLRNVPDVSMEGDYDNYVCNLGNCTPSGAGTSFAAPRWAGFMALVNQQAVEAGNAPLGGIGFINTALTRIGTGANYSTDLHDIQSGNNDTANQTVWFSAVNGYDLVTGLGSPAGQALIDELAGKAVPGFWVSSSTGTISVVEASTATATISVISAGGFSDSVNLAVTSTLPSGVTASFNPASTTGTSVLTFTASASAAQGSYQVNITGTSGAITESTTVTLVVHGPSFSLSASQSSLNINRNSSQVSTITVNDLYGFTGNVTLQANGLPTGLTASFGTNPTGSTSVLTLTADNTAVFWSGYITVVGTSGSLTASTQIHVAIVAPTFTLIVPTTYTIGQGTTGSIYVNVSQQNGFNGNVTLSLSGLPVGVTAFFIPNPISTSGSINLVAAGDAAVGGPTAVTVTGTSGAITVTTTINITVKAPTFTLNTSDASLGVGGTATNYVYVNPQYGFTGGVTLSASGLPAGVTATFATNPTTSMSTMSLSSSSSAVPGTYAVTIKGAAGSITANATFNLTVGAPTFTVSSPGSVTLSQGGSVQTYLYINSQFGFNGSVTFSVSGLPAGVTASFGNNPTTYSTQMVLSASSTTSLGNYTPIITGTSGSISKSATMPLTVAAPSMQLSGPGSVTMGIGTTYSTSVSVFGNNGYSGSATLSITGLPSGITASFGTNPVSLSGYNSSSLLLTASASVAGGSYSVVLTATSGSIVNSTAIVINVAAPSFTLSGATALTISQGSSQGASISVNATNGFNSPVTLSVSGLPSGISAAFTANPTTYSSTINFSATNAATTGTYPITIMGTSGTLNATSTITLTIVAPSFTLSVGQNALTVVQGASYQSYLYVNGSSGFSGPVTLSASGLPAGVTLNFSTNPTTSYSASTFVASGAATPGTSTVTITGTYGTVTASTTLALTVVAPSFTLTPLSGVAFQPAASGKTTVGVIGANGFTGSVTFSVTGLPAGVTGSWNPASSTTSSVLTLTANSSVPPGTTTATITGTSGALSATTPLPITIRGVGSATATALTITSGGGATTTSTWGTLVTLSASVTTNGTPVTPGLVNFCDSSASSCSDIHLLGSAQLSPGGTASINMLPLPGSHSYKAVFTGTTGYVASSSAAGTLQVTGAYPTATALTSAGAVGNYTLTSQVNASGPLAPSGNISFIDTSNSNASIATANLVAGTPSLAYSQFGPAPTGSSPGSMVSGDFNGDGIADVAILNTQYGAIVIELGNPDGSFTVSANSPPTPSSPVSITAADFNSDGKLDLAVVSQSGVINIYLGNGDGSFNPAVSSTNLASQTSGIVSGDFNQDGIPDLAIMNTGSNSIAILLGRGDGSFVTSTSAPSLGTTPRCIAAADVNSDGYLDLIVGTSSGTVTTLLGNGDGTFIVQPNNLSVVIYPSTFAVADFNHDGKPDLLEVSSYATTLVVLLGNGDGTFTVSNGPSVTNNPTAAVAMDVNQDGVVDLVLLSSYTPNAAVFWGKGDGTFTSGGTMTMPSTVTSAVVAGTTSRGYPAIINAYGTLAQVAAVRPYLAQSATASATNISMGATGSHKVAASYPGDTTYATSQSDTVTLNGSKNDSIITWPAPSAIMFGTALDSAQLNATANVPGTFVYTPAAGTVPGVGLHTLSVTFTPTDSNYTIVSATVSLVVNKATPTITWATPAAILHGTALGPNQLNATSVTPGSFAYLPAAGSVLGVGPQTLSTTFTPTDSTNYTTATASVILTVNAATPTITWAPPSAITYGTALSATQLNASATVPGTFVYSPPAGTVLGVGSQTLSTTFTPTDSTNYATATASVTLTVSPATPTITWATPSAISYGTTLSAAQLNASSTITGSFAYTPALGAVLQAGSQTLSVTFTPADGSSYISTTKAVQLAVNKATPVVVLSASTGFQFQSGPVSFSVALAAVAGGGLPTGSITFSDGSTALGNASLANGTASYSTSSLGVGAHSITATYSGDSNYIAATSSSAIAETIGTMTITSTGSSGASVDASPGGQAVFTLTFAPANGQTFPQAIQLSLSGLPSGANASFSPNTIPAGSGTTTVVLTVSVPTTATVLPLSNPFGKESLPIALGLLLLPFAVKFRRAGRKLQRGSHVSLIVVAAIGLTTAMAVGLSGCGGGAGSGGGSGNPSPRTYPLTVTATSGSYTQTTALTLVVK